MTRGALSFYRLDALFVPAIVIRMKFVILLSLVSSIATAQLQIPPPPNSNQWVVLTFATQATNVSVFQRDSLAPGIAWTPAATVTTGTVSFLIDKRVPARFFSASIKPTPTNWVSLAWNASTDQNVVGYNIYFGGQSGVYTNQIDFGKTTNGVIAKLSPGQKYYFAATAYNILDIESAFSGEVVYTLPTNSCSLKINIDRFPKAPAVTTLTASSVTPTNAVINGKVNSTGGDLPATFFFYGQFDPTTDTNSDWEAVALAGTSTNAASVALAGLAPGTTYFYSFAAVNAAGSMEGAALSFSTAPAFALMSPKASSILSNAKPMRKTAKPKSTTAPAPPPLPTF